MTNDELRAVYNVAYKIIARHRKVWTSVVETQPQWAEKLRELDRLQEILTQMKDELKEQAEREVSPQPRLLDVPRRTEYG